MASIRVPNGFDLKLEGRPENELVDGVRPSRVAIQPADFHGFRPSLLVKQGDPVKIGTPLIESKDDPRIRLGSPASGRVEKIVLGARRSLLEVVVALEGGEAHEEFPKAEDAAGLDRRKIIDALLGAGLWPLVRQWPFGTIAAPDDLPKAIFVSAMQADPFEPHPDLLLDKEGETFRFGLALLGKLSDGKLYLGVDADREVPAWSRGEGFELRRFSGRYPKGRAEVHAYWTDRPARGERAWFLYWQDVLAIARSFKAGRPCFDRTVATAGPGFAERKAFRTRLGASVESLSTGRRGKGKLRFVSGSVLSGRTVRAEGFVGFYDTVLNALREGTERRLLGFMRPGLDSYTRSRAYLSAVVPKKAYALSTSRNGSERAFVLTDLYREACPVEIWPDHLAKALLAGDLEAAEKHGVLDCVHCGLCTFVDPSKNELGAILHEGLETIRREG